MLDFARVSLYESLDVHKLYICVLNKSVLPFTRTSLRISQNVGHPFGRISHRLPRSSVARASVLVVLSGVSFFKLLPHLNTLGTSGLTGQSGLFLPLGSVTALTG